MTQIFDPVSAQMTEWNGNVHWGSRARLPSSPSPSVLMLAAWVTLGVYFGELKAQLTSPYLQPSYASQLTVWYVPVWRAPLAPSSTEQALVRRLTDIASADVDQLEKAYRPGVILSPQ